MTWDSVLLAGGYSRRFGSDKAFAEWHGVPLYLRQLGKLLRLAPCRAWLSSRTDQRFPVHLEGVTRIDDESPGLGPMGGLLGVFRASTADFILVLAVDLPLVMDEYLGELVAACRREAVGKVPRRNGRWEPLAGIYPRVAMLEILESRVAAGDLALQAALDEAEARGVIRGFSPSHPAQLKNLNRREDLEASGPPIADGAVSLRRFRQGAGFGEREPDWLAREEPLEIRVNGRSVAVMMRTPGHDEELALGFLRSEGVIGGAIEVTGVESRADDRGHLLLLTIGGTPDLDALTRHVFTSSSCGVCGKATIESVFQAFPPITQNFTFDPEVILGLPDKLRRGQDTFDRTGGLHASAVFTRAGELIVLREDVGRHNALDKVIGHGLKRGIDFGDALLLVSGRISFELMQKALAGGIPLVAGISAPSSLAVEFAHRSGQTLIGFLRGGGFYLFCPKA